MDYFEAINTRISRRTYLDTPIEAKKLQQLENIIDKYNKEADLSMALVPDGSSAFSGLRKSYGMFKNVRSIIVLKGKKEDPNLNEKTGQFGEMLVLEATKMGLGTCWVGGTFDRDNTVLKAGANEELTCVITIGNVVSDQSFKEKMIRNLTHRKTKPVEAFYEADTAVPQWFLAGIQAVQKAPSAVNLQPVKFEYKKGEVTAFVKEERFLTDLGIAKAHFSLTAGGTFEFGNHGKFTKE